MQKALKEDEELHILVQAAGETIRAMEFYFPSWHVAVVTGIDKDRSVTRIVSTVEALQLVCRVSKIAPPATPARIKFVTPKPKSD